MSSQMHAVTVETVSTAPEDGHSEDVHSKDMRLDDVLLAEADEDRSGEDRLSKDRLGEDQPGEIDSQIEQAIAPLLTGDFHSRWTQAKLLSQRLSQWGDRALPLLIKHLKAQCDPDAQWFLVRLLSQFNRPVTIEALSALWLKTESEPLQVEISKALSGFGASAIATLTELLCVSESVAKTDAKAHEQRLLAARTLAHIRRSGTIEPLISIAADPSPELREIAIEALGSFHDPRITPLLLAALEDEPAIAIEAIRTLGRRSDLLGRVDLVTPLQRGLRSPNESVACESAIALGRLGHERAIVALGTHLHQPLPTTVKLSMVQALGWLSVPSAVAYLVDAFDCDMPVIMPVARQALAKALGQTRDLALKSVASQPLIRWLQAELMDAELNQPAAGADFALTQTVLTALTRLKDPAALQSLVPVLSHHDPRIRLHVLSALKQIDPRAAQNEIQAYLHRETLSADIKRSVVETLTAW